MTTFQLDSHAIKYRVEDDAGSVLVAITLSLRGPAGEAAQIEFGGAGESIETPAGGTPKAYLELSRFQDFYRSFEHALDNAPVTVNAGVDVSGVEIVEITTT
jgi:hypothetical protein